jgi:hypothetical protein
MTSVDGFPSTEAPIAAITSIRPTSPKSTASTLRVTFQTGGNTRRAAAPAGESARPVAAPARDWRNAMAAAAAALKTAAWLG